MKLAIIADDLTGANDSGVQLARQGLKTSVLFDMDKANVNKYEAVVFDTDSRSVSRQEAYQRVSGAANFLIGAGFSNIFKKLDSTMRGNIGAEIDALYDAMKPDFMMIAPGYPKNSRTILQSTHYLKGVPLAETEIAKDPKTPVTISYLPDLLKEQTDNAVGSITVDDLALGKNHIERKLQEYKNSHIPYIIIDSTEEDHLEQILAFAKGMEYKFTWVGSAGIANYLPAYYELSEKPVQLHIKPSPGPILTVVGSVNKNSRAQLNLLLEQADVHPIAFHSYTAVSDNPVRSAEMNRVYEEAEVKALEGKDIVIYSKAEEQDIDQARETGEARGLNHTEISNEIVKAMGAVCAKLLEQGYFKGVSMTGGDTAKQICMLWDIKGFELLDEMEIGVPISTFLGIEHLHVITKAGGFGSPEVFINAIHTLKGDPTS